MNDYTAHDIHRLDQAYPDAVNTIDDLTGDPARKARLAEVGPEVFAAELTRDLAASAGGPMSLAAWAAVATVQLMSAAKTWEDDTDAAWAKVADRNASLDRVIAERDALTEAQDRAAKRINGLRDYILGSLDEDLPLVAEELRNASLDLADALADLGHPVTDEDEDKTPRRPVVTVELPTEAATR